MATSTIKGAQTDLELFEIDLAIAVGVSRRQGVIHIGHHIALEVKLEESSDRVGRLMDQAHKTERK